MAHKTRFTKLVNHKTNMNFDSYRDKYEIGIYRLTVISIQVKVYESFSLKYYQVFKKFFKLLICYLTFLWNISSRCRCQRIINFCIKRKHELFQKGIKSADLFSKFSWNISSHSRRRRITKRSDPTGFSPFCG